MAPNAPERADLETLIAEQATAVDMPNHKPAALWLKLLEAEAALIPDGLHVVGKPMSAAARADYLDLLPPMDDITRAKIDHQRQQDTEIPGILRALSARFITPVPGGDLIRSPQILLTGRNIQPSTRSGCPPNSPCATVPLRPTVFWPSTRPCHAP